MSEADLLKNHDDLKNQCNLNDNDDIDDRDDIDDDIDDNNYDYNFLCTYQLLDDKDDSTLCYQLQFLQAFNMPDYDSVQIEKITKNLYEELKDDPTFIRLINKLKNSVENNINYAGFLNGTCENSLTDDDIFCFVFCYEYFHKFHSQYIAYKNNKNYNFDSII